MYSLFLAYVKLRFSSMIFHRDVFLTTSTTTMTLLSLNMVLEQLLYSIIARFAFLHFADPKVLTPSRFCLIVFSRGGGDNNDASTASSQEGKKPTREGTLVYIIVPLLKASLSLFSSPHTTGSISKCVCVCMCV